MLVYIKTYARSKMIWELQYGPLYLCRHGLFDDSILDLIDKYFVECGNILDRIFLFHTSECDLHISHLELFLFNEVPHGLLPEIDHTKTFEPCLGKACMRSVE